MWCSRALWLLALPLKSVPGPVELKENTTLETISKE